MNNSLRQKLIGFAQLLRIHQYYKNLIVFVGFLFGGELGDFTSYPKLLLGFGILCVASSVNYIINDIKDREADKLHPEKLENRPIANGTISVGSASIVLVILIALLVIVVFFYWGLFAFLLGLMLLNGLLYNFVLKNHPFADVIGLSTIYIWRALAGCAIIGVSISSWLTITVFLTALFLATGKRIADLELLGDNKANLHKKVYEDYSKDLLDKFLTIVATSLFMTYTLYCVLGPSEEDSFVAKSNGFLVYSTPIALFLIFRFIFIVKNKPKIARKTQKLIHDKPFVVGAFILALFVLCTLYLNLDGFLIS